MKYACMSLLFCAPGGNMEKEYTKDPREVLKSVESSAEGLSAH